MVCQCYAHQVLGDLGEHRRRGDRRIEDHRPRHRPHVGEAHANRHGSPCEVLGAEPRGDAIGQVPQRGYEDPLDSGFPSEGGVRAGGTRASMRADFARIAVPREGAELLPGGVSEQSF
jgi:hypothetical protein